jgi:hypothetical protein
MAAVGQQRRQSEQDPSNAIRARLDWFAKTNPPTSLTYIYIILCCVDYVCTNRSRLLIHLLIPRTVVHVLVRVHGGLTHRIRADAAVVTVVVIVIHGIPRLFLAVFFCK